MKTCKEAIAIAQQWEDEKSTGPAALVGRALLAHINSLASPQVTDEQYVLKKIIDALPIRHDWLDPDVEKAARAILALSAPPAAETRSCECHLRTQLVGDGCDVCNPEYAAKFAAASQEAGPPLEKSNLQKVHIASHAADEGAG